MGLLSARGFERNLAHTTENHVQADEGLARSLMVPTMARRDPGAFIGVQPNISIAMAFQAGTHLLSQRFACYTARSPLTCARSQE